MFQLLLQRMPVGICRKVVSFRRWQDSYGCLFGRLLLKRALLDEAGQDRLVELRYSPLGRPYFPGGPDFNISHSGNRVILVLSAEGRVGIDLEEINELQIHEFRPQFSSKEWSAICKAGSPLHQFYQYWTAKESVLKAEGMGLNWEMAEVDVTGETVILKNKIWNLRSIDLFSDYCCHIAYDGENPDMDVKEFLPVELALE